MDNAISRYAAISVFTGWMQKEFGYLDLNRSERFINAIESLPSVEQERESGEWIHDGHEMIRCSRCGLVFKDLNWHYFRICPYCGGEWEWEGEKDG